MPKSKINDIKLFGFSLLLGATAGLVVWLFLKAVQLVTILLWEMLPQAVPFRFWPIVIGAVGGFFIGLLHKKFGNYPEELKVILAKIKTENHFAYHPMLVRLLCAFIPLVIGASVGPEAGLTGLIAGLCYWVGDNIKIANEHKKEYSMLGEAVTLGVLFHVPLFGLFAVEENEEDEAGDIVVPKAHKVILYGAAIADGFLVYGGLSGLFGKPLSGIPGFDVFAADVLDYAACLLYLPVGVAAGGLFLLSERLIGTAASHVPFVAREILGGIVLGAVGCFAPIILFSGEEEMGVLAETFGNYAPALLIGIAVLKIFMSAFSISFGLKGGHFFPLIFACVCLGFGVGMLLFGLDFAHLVFAAGVVTAACLGAQLKKPLAVAMLCLLCFPLRMLLVLFVAAAVGSVVGKWRG